MITNIETIVKENTTRINWDEYFMSITLLASCRSSCTKLHVGSVIVKDNRIIAMGYNGFLPEIKHMSRLVDGHEQSTVHSEINAITDCAKMGVGLDGSQIYVTHYPCINCFKAIASCGIEKIIYLNDYNNDPLVDEIADEFEISIVKYIQSYK
jgi:dCMP deaminase